MIFTRENSLQDIVLSSEDMRTWLNVFFGEGSLGMFPKEMQDRPLREVEKVAVTPWNDPFSAVVDQLLMAAEMIADIKEGAKYRAVALWHPEKAWQIGDGRCHGTKEDVALIVPGTPKKGRRPAVIICPGGGYVDVCISGEGTPVLKKMEEAGYAAFMLRYRVAPAVYPQPQEDLMLAIKHVQANAEYYGADLDNILLIGFSAAGHLCALTAARYEELEQVLQAELELELPQLAGQYRAFQKAPGKLGLAYPVISLSSETHEGSAENLTGGKRGLRKALSVETLVTKAYPQTFLWACADDDVVPPSNALRMMSALSANGVRYEGHIYPTGGHGCSLAEGKSAQGWLDRLIRFMQ